MLRSTALEPGVPALLSSSSSITAASPATVASTAAAAAKPFFGRCRPVHEFERVRRVGEGTYGVVYCVRDRASGRTLALKTIRLDTNAQEGIPVPALREIALLKSISHTNVINVVDVVVGKDLGQMDLKLSNLLLTSEGVLKI
ncbi:Cyclin-dependent kinase 10, partial [Cladochytrium tenue]